MRTPSNAALAAFRTARGYLAADGARVVVLTVPAARAAITEGTPAGPCALGRAPAPRLLYPSRPDVPGRVCDWSEAWDRAGWPGACCVLSLVAPPENDNPHELDRELVLTIASGPWRIVVRLPSLSVPSCVESQP